jgi:hypothetical protein
MLPNEKMKWCLVIFGVLPNIVVVIVSLPFKETFMKVVAAGNLL